MAQSQRRAGTSPGSVTFKYISQAGGPGDPAAGDPFYITGKLAALDAAGEWFRDAAANTLYLWTPTGDSPANHLVEAKARTYGFELSGLSYITIRGINFFACSINTSSTSTHDTIDGIQALYVSHFEQASGQRDALDAAHGRHGHYHPRQQQHPGEQRNRLLGRQRRAAPGQQYVASPPATWSPTT